MMMRGAMVAVLAWAGLTAAEPVVVEINGEALTLRQLEDELLRREGVVSLRSAGTSLPMTTRSSASATSP